MLTGDVKETVDIAPKNGLPYVFETTVPLKVSYIGVHGHGDSTQRPQHGRMQNGKPCTRYRRQSR